MNQALYSESLSIMLHYGHADAGVWSLCTLAAGHGVIAADDLDAAGFYSAVGALSMTISRIFRFLYVGEAGDLTAYVYFLIGTLVGLSHSNLAPSLERLRPDARLAGRENLVGNLIQEDQSLLLVSRAGAGILALSYLNSSGEAPDLRGRPYFDRLLVSETAFRRASVEALDEYVAVAAHQLQGAQEGKLHDLVQLWVKHRAVLGELL